MQVASSVLDAIGNTPLLRLRRASEMTGCEILAKAEFMNPGQSVKDRAALYIIRDAERRGDLRPGGRIVEGTAGNTGIGGFMCRSPGDYCRMPTGQCRVPDASGVCTPRPQVCTRIYQPVCGCDGRTYGNSCEAESAGTNPLHAGACR